MVMARKVDSWCALFYNQKHIASMFSGYITPHAKAMIRPTVEAFTRALQAEQFSNRLSVYYSPIENEEAFISWPLSGSPEVVLGLSAFEDIERIATQVVKRISRGFCRFHIDTLLEIVLSSD